MYLQHALPHTHNPDVVYSETTKSITTRMISGMFVVLGKTPMRNGMNKPQAITIISFVVNGLNPGVSVGLSSVILRVSVVLKSTVGDID